jgi:hypothetical protein
MRRDVDDRRGEIPGLRDHRAKVRAAQELALKAAGYIVEEFNERTEEACSPAAL